MKYMKVLLLALLVSAPALAVTGGDNPFTPYTQTNAISVSNVASTGIQPSTAGNCTQYKLENAGTVDMWVAFGTTSGNAAQIPTAGVPKASTLVKAGATTVVTQIPSAFISAIQASSTGTLYVSCGTGLATGVAGGSAAGSGAAATQVQGTAADGAAAVGNPVQAGGVDGSGNAQSILTGTDGRLAVNESQINSVTVSTGTGVMGTGVQRVAIASDNDPVTVKQATAANLNAQVQGSTASGSPIVDKPLAVGGSDGTNVRTIKTFTDGTLLGASAGVAGADAASNTINTNIDSSSNPMRFFVRPELYNGSTADRQRSAGIGNGVAATGIAAATPYGEFLTNANQPAITTGQYTALMTDAAGNLRIAPQRPTATDIVPNSASVTATTGTTALTTIAAARTWSGQVCISVYGTKAATATGDGSVLGTVLSVGTNVAPAAGTYFEVDTGIGANAATGTVGTQGSNANCIPWTQTSPAGNSTTINYVTTCTNTTTCRISVSAYGIQQ